jgi:hypothetical protein
MPEVFLGRQELLSREELIEQNFRFRSEHIWLRDVLNHQVKRGNYATEWAVFGWGLAIVEAICLAIRAM